MDVNLSVPVLLIHLRQFLNSLEILFPTVPSVLFFRWPYTYHNIETMAYASEKVWHKDILYDTDIGSVDKFNGSWIYFQVCTNKFKIKYSFRGLRWNNHGKAVSHMESKLKQEHSKSGETSPLKISAMMSFISASLSTLVDEDSSSYIYISRER